MKKLLVLIASVVFLNSCAPVLVVDSKQKQASAQKQAPPGQVKKTTGSKSAKAYAPGQQKKKN